MPYSDPARQKQAERAWWEKNRQYANTRAKKYQPAPRRVLSTNPKAVARRAAYAADPSRDIAYVKSWKAENALAAKAHQKVRRAVRLGILVVPKVCSVCHQPGDIQAHHDDYAKPLEVRWTCGSCHRRLDEERRQRETGGVNV